MVYSMAEEPEIDFIRFAIKNVIDDKIEGDILEMGVWKGGMGIWMNYLLHHYRASTRNLWLFDAFEEFPEPKYEGDKYVHPVSKILYERFPSIENVKSNFEKFELLTNNLCFVKGRFDKSVSNVDIPQISILHLDCDYYDSTLICLEKYYPQISPGGYVIVNRYHYEHVHARKAIDEYREKYKIQHPIHRIGNTYIYWRV